jgi:hypothetical protein
MNNNTLLALLTAGLLAPIPLLAQEEATPPAAPDQAKPDAPPPPMPADEREEIEPQVTIIRQEDRTIEEYRINGQLYMVKVTPSKGYPYYLVDADGDGQLESRRNELDPKILVPSWVILRW